MGESDLVSLPSLVVSPASGPLNEFSEGCEPCFGASQRLSVLVLSHYVYADPGIARQQRRSPPPPKRVRGNDGTKSGLVSW